jgi:nucleotide-binding universal stress UspA family protein
VPQPGDPDPVPTRQGSHLRAQTDDVAHDLVARDDRTPVTGQVAVGDVQIGTADPTGTDPHEHVARTRDGNRNLVEPQRTVSVAVGPPGAHHRSSHADHDRTRRRSIPLAEAADTGWQGAREVTTMYEETPAVIACVSIDGAPSAVEYAAREALLADAPLHIIHVLRMPAVDAYAGVYGGALEEADTAISEAVERARTLTDDQVRITAERVDDGALISHLVHRANHGRLVVLQHRRLSRARRMVTGSTVNAVAARTTVPVVSVPEGWTRTNREPVVTVGIQDSQEAPGLLRAGFEEARMRHARLAAIHTWWLDTDWDPSTLDQEYRADRDASTRREFGPVLDAIQIQFPEVKASLEVWNAPPADALLDAAKESEVLILGRRHHLLPLGGHLGPVARAILAHGDCPVFLTPEPHRAEHRVRRSSISGVMY